jgi:hypothetical protein
MSRCFNRLLVVFVAALAATLAPLSTNAGMGLPRSDCCEHATHAGPDCSDCIVCVTGLNCVLPVTMPAIPGTEVVIARLAWQAFTAEMRADPPPLPPPRNLA